MPLQSGVARSDPLPYGGAHPLIRKLRELDVNSLTPYAALQLLSEWQEEIGAASRTAPK